MTADRRPGTALPAVIAILSLTALAGLRPRIASAAPATAPPAPATAPTGGRHALLVGVTRYPSLPPERQLHGGTNDVALMRQFLRDQFQFPDTDIVTLQDGQDPAKLPTHANILRELAALGGRAAAGDRVVVFFSGHGSLQPHVKKPTDTREHELDGLFLPMDIGKWDSEVQTVQNALVDHELSDWVKGLRDKHVSLWLIVDACHSGGLAREKGRGGAGEVERDVPPAELGIPADKSELAVRRAAARSEKSRGLGEPDSGLDLSTDLPGVAAIYACRSSETTVEKPFPEDVAADSPASHPYGLFTYTLTRALARASGKLTYSELVRQVNAEYAAMGRYNPIPMVEGAARDQEVLGETVRHSDVRLGHDHTGMLVNAGRIQGFYNGTIFAVYPAPGAPDADKVVGYVKVEDASAMSAYVKPCEYKGAAAVDVKSLKDESVCRPEYVDFGIEPLRVFVKDDAAKKLGAGLAKLAEDQKSLVTLLPAGAGGADLVPANAEFIVDAAAGGLVVRDQTSARDAAGPATKPAESAAPATDASAGAIPPETRQRVGASAGRSFSVPDSAGDPEASLAAVLRRIAQARSLLKTASAGGAGGGWTDKPDVAVEMYYFRGRGSEPKKVQWPGNGVTLQDGDFIAFKLLNRSKAPVDMTLLFIDSGYGIKPFYPRGERTAEAVRVPAGETVRTDLIRISATDSFGPEQIVLLAVSGEDGDYHDFRFLAQPTLEAAREKARGMRGGSGMDSPLGKVLQTARFGNGASRGADAVSLAGYDVKVMNWWTNPAPPPAPAGRGQ